MSREGEREVSQSASSEPAGAVHRERRAKCGSVVIQCIVQQPLASDQPQINHRDARAKETKSEGGLLTADHETTEKG